MKTGILRRFLLWGTGLSAAGCLAALFLLADVTEASAVPLRVILLTAALLMTAAFAAARQGVFEQLDSLYTLICRWDELSPQDRAERLNSLSGPVGQTGQAVSGLLERMEQDTEEFRAEAGAKAERAVRLNITKDICASALPQVLQDYPSRENFTVAGIVRDGAQPACVFYDYFYIDPGLLCVSIGQVPDGEVPEALYMLVAQTTIRSRLRMGLSLAETISHVNTQMYDFGTDRDAAVLVGVLDTADGRFSYVNAGSLPPFLMRNEQEFELLDTPVCASLGLYQNVSYTVQELRLRQGDRLVFHTAGLGGTKNADGETFRERAMRSALNRTRRAEPEANLEALAESASDWCASENERLGYAALELEFRKGDLELAHCRVTALPAYSGEMLAFLKQRFADNGIPPRHYARSAVLADELFSLFCQQAEPGSEVTVECGIAPDGGAVTLRMSGVLGGKNPLTVEGEGPAAASAAYIRKHADRSDFQPGDGRDSVTLVCFFVKDAPQSDDTTMPAPQDEGPSP